MNYAELRDLFKGTLNRTDCTNTEADRFLSLGLRRVERIIRTPLQEKLATMTVPENFTELAIPPDFLATINMSVDGRPLTRIGHLADVPEGQGTPSVFRIETNTISINPKPKVGSTVKLLYFGEMTRPEGDTDTVPYTDTISDLVLYAALVPAAIFFTDSRLQDFRSEMAALGDEVQTQADMASMSGGLFITNPYAGAC